MKKLVIVLSLIALTSCATIFSGSRAKITIDNRTPITEPVTLSVDDQVYYDVEFPYVVKVKRGFESSYIVAKAKGYEDGRLTVEKDFNPITLINIFGSLMIGGAVDGISGAMMKPSETHYMLNMQPKNYVEQVADQVQAEVASVNLVAQASAKSVSVRCRFDSQPQGARLFWRVISSCPDQVQSTDELWLGNTPFEETRSFNIQGLTYENASEVQIEVLVRCNGYVEQTKQFNLQQVIYQQEISSFFDLVKAGE